MVLSISILHISSNYSCTHLYSELIREQVVSGLSLSILIPERRPSLVGKYWVEDGNVRYKQPLIIRPLDKVLYFSKIKRGMRYSLESLSLETVQLMHAHTLFTDGGIAYEIWKKLRIPYIVAVRSGDVNCFFKYAVHLRSYGLNILKNASGIIFLSTSYRNKILQLCGQGLFSEIEKKSFVVPNGIGIDWFKDQQIKQSFNTPLRISYVADNFSKRKNPFAAVRAIQRLNSEGVSSELVMIGKGDKFRDKLENEPFVRLHDPITSVDGMKRFYEESDIFLLPSTTETFGLVYAEAISRGIPVLYTEKQGFDGQFPDGEVGYPIDPMDLNDIVDKIKKCTQGINSRSERCVAGSRRFLWSEIANKYAQIYGDVLCSVKD